MKKYLAIMVATSILLLSACNTTQDTSASEPLAEQTTGSEVINNTNIEPAIENTTAPSTKSEAPAEPSVEQTTEQEVKEETAAIQKVYIYESDAQATTIQLRETLDHTFTKDGPITKYILNELGLMDYYNNHTVSADEKTIVLDFKKDILTSNLVQGSAGGHMFISIIEGSFFKSIPTLETLKLRVEGEEVELDHVMFAEETTREEAEKMFPQIVGE